MRVGIIGVGLMGHGIALNVLKGGFPLVMMDHPGNQPVEDLIGMGAGKQGSPTAGRRRQRRRQRGPGAPAPAVLICSLSSFILQHYSVEQDGFSFQKLSGVRGVLLLMAMEMNS